MANTSHFTTILTEPVQHPYYPQTASIPQYTPNINSVFYLLTTFFSACLTLISTTYTLTTHINPKLTRTQLATVIWFVLSGSIHVFFEGFYVAHFADLAGNQSLMGQMWKEYALSDSRYLTENSLVLCLEGITTVIWGPGCFLCAWLVAKGHPGRWGIVGVVSLGELLGDVVYYATSFFDHHSMGISYSRPEAFYLWFYFVLMNAFWVVIPGALIYQSLAETTRAMRMVESMEQGKKAR